MRAKHVELEGKGISNANVRVANRKRLVQLLLHSKGLTRQEVAHQLQLSLPTVNLLLGQLEQEGYIVKQSAQVSSGGRIPDIVSFQHNARVAFGVETSFHHVRVLLINMAGSILCEEYIRLPFENTDAYWAGIKARLDSLLEARNIPGDRVMGVGIAFPGVMRKEQGAVRVISRSLLPDDYFIIGPLEEKWGWPVCMENEANAAGYAEVWSRDNLENAVYLSITMGLGGAILLGGKLLYGQNGYGGEFGHMTLLPGGKQCSCGKKGCFKAYCATSSLTSLVDGGLEEFFAQKETSPKLQQAWEEYLDHLALGVSNICVAWDIPVIIGGDIRPYLEEDCERLVQAVEKAIPFENRFTPCSLSKTGKEAAALGAVLAVVEQFVTAL